MDWQYDPPCRPPIRLALAMTITKDQERYVRWL